MILGIATPLVISFVTMFMSGNTEPLLIVAIVCHTIGAFALKYSVLKVGIYRSVLPVSDEAAARPCQETSGRSRRRSADACSVSHSRGVKGRQWLTASRS